MVYFVLAAFAVNLIVCVTLYLLPRGHFKQTELRRAFEALEDEFEDLRESVRSSVGRISRLKRSMIESTQSASPGDPAGAGSEPVAATPPSGSLSERQKAWQSKILARRGLITQ